ncbi:MAG: DUF1854 domain-containing protein [Bacteriovoracaceae bacterium]|nr:DUF1854 domain-containing protein [Bacteriovoracaceae bacterium]
MKKNIKLFMGKSGQLLFSDAQSKVDSVEVSAKQCFPWSDPDKYISLQNQSGDEVYLIKDMAKMEVATQYTLQKHLKQVQFVMDVNKLVAIEEDIELRKYDVVTKQGPRVFQTLLEDWPKVSHDGQIVLKDIAGDIFVIESVESLDKKSQKLISTYID